MLFEPGLTWGSRSTGEPPSGLWPRTCVCTSWRDARSWDTGPEGHPGPSDSSAHVTLKKIQSNKNSIYGLKYTGSPVQRAWSLRANDQNKQFFQTFPPTSVQGPVPPLPTHVKTYLTWTLLEVLCCRKVMFSVMSVCQSSYSRGVPTV